MRLVSLREGGGFSNEKYSEVALPSNAFILQDDEGISVIDIEKKKGTLIQKVNGDKNNGMFIEKRESGLDIHTNGKNRDNNKRNYIRIEMSRGQPNNNHYQQ